MKTAGPSLFSDMALYQLLTGSPLGPLTLSGTETALTGLAFSDVREAGDHPSPVLEQAAEELAAYFAGARREFTVPLAPAGSSFQKKVWGALRDVPYGTTASYKEIAQRIGKPGAAIAVGQANSRNPIPVIIPCHRVIGAGGKLVGYTGGLHIKTALLGLEGVL